MRHRFREGHLGAILQWQSGERVGARTIAIAALGVAVPVAAGLALGRAETGFTIGLGAMLLAGGTGPDRAATQGRPSPGSAVAPALVAVLAATAVAGLPWPSADLAMVVLATAAAAVSGYSRAIGVGAIRFLIYFVLSLGLLADAGAHRGGAALVFGLGALWNIVVRMMLGRREATPDAVAAKPAPTAAQLRANWRRTMREAAGWQFPIRLGVGLTVASALRHIWPDHHYGWIVLTVALLTQRPLEHVPVRITQRALGTLLGVGLTWAILREAPPVLVLAVLICLFATLAPIARSRSYLAYAVCSTPAILLVLDIGKPIGTALLADRLVATLAGAAIVIAANVAIDRWLPKSKLPQRGPRRRSPVSDGTGAQPSTPSPGVSPDVSPSAAGRSK